MPHAHDLPSFKVGLTETKAPSNPLGIKGCGEAGAIASPAAVINAITDAIGTEDLAMPATAQAVWSAAHAYATASCRVIQGDSDVQFHFPSSDNGSSGGGTAGA